MKQATKKGGGQKGRQGKMGSNKAAGAGRRPKSEMRTMKLMKLRTAGMRLRLGATTRTTVIQVRTRMARTRTVRTAAAGGKGMQGGHH